MCCVAVGMVCDMPKQPGEFKQFERCRSNHPSVTDRLQAEALDDPLLLLLDHLLSLIKRLDDFFFCLG